MKWLCEFTWENQKAYYTEDTRDPSHTTDRTFFSSLATYLANATNHFPQNRCITLDNTRLFSLSFILFFQLVYTKLPRIWILEFLASYSLVTRLSFRSRFSTVALQLLTQTSTTYNPPFPATCILFFIHPAVLKSSYENSRKSIHYIL